MKFEKIVQQLVALLNMLIHIFCQLQSVPAENPGCIASKEPCLQMSGDGLDGPAQYAGHVNKEILT